MKATVAIPSLNKTVTVERNLGAPTRPTITPDDPAAVNVLQQVQAHPEVVLSRRELIRYVLATPGKRADEIQALLHLSEVEKVRALLQKIANACEKELAPLEASVTQSSASLLTALGVPDLSAERVLAAANGQRAIIGLPALAQLSESISLKEGISGPDPTPPRIPKAQASADICATRDAIAELTGTPTLAVVEQVTSTLQRLADDPAIVSGAKQEAFLSAGIDLLDSSSCPFCDTEWNLAELRAHVQEKMAALAKVTQQRKEVQTALVPVVACLQRVQASISTLGTHAALASPPLDLQAAYDYAQQCATAAERLQAFLPISEAVAALAVPRVLPQGALDAIAVLAAKVTALPEPTKQDAAREWLAVAQERLDVWRGAVTRHESGEQRALLTRSVADTYAKTSDAVLSGIYEAVQDDFASLYGFINREDETHFSATLYPSMGKLGFDVDFYGRGLFPPGAYHSEGHQDGMGLCLYLALMRHLQGKGFTFAVLDDVLMSVDASHRREVCALLKSEFPETQFIMTTHDPIWLRHMRTAKLIEARCATQFRTWDVEHGPTQWDDRDVWVEIDDYLKLDDIRGGASLLRHYLEYASAELCHRLRAPVEFRGDARYQLGELLPPAVSRMRKLYSKGKDAASSWGNRDSVQQLSARATHFSQLAEASQAEQWQVNAAVHYNTWATLGRNDFRQVVAAVSVRRAHLPKRRWLGYDTGAGGVVFGVRVVPQS